MSSGANATLVLQNLRKPEVPVDFGELMLSFPNSVIIRYDTMALSH